MVPVRTQTPNEPSLGADAHALLGLTLTPILSIVYIYVLSAKKFS